MKPTIALCMMAKNEEDVIGRAINSAREIADEIILVDTGSTDSTNHIASSLGAQIFFHPWEDHFSKSRNHMLSHATADWVLYIDADEELHSSDRQTLLKMVRTAPKSVLGFHLLKQDLDLDQDTYTHQHYTIRLFRRTPGIHFVGRVHNQLIIDQKKCKHTSIRLLHHIYNKRQQRNARSIKLLELSLEENPNAHYLKLNLGGMYCQAGQYEKGIPVLKDACENIATPTMKAKACFILAMNLIGLEAYDESEHYLLKSLDIVPCFVSARFTLADLYATRYDQLEKAISEMERIVITKIKPPLEFMDMGTNPVTETVSAPWNLAIYYRAAGRLQEAEDLLVRVLEHKGDHEAAVRTDLADVLSMQGKFLQAGEELRAVEKQRPGILDIGVKLGAVLEQAGELDASLAVVDTYLQQAPDNYILKTARGRLLLKLGELHSAESALREAVKTSPLDYEASHLLLADCLRRRAEEERNPLLLKESVSLVKKIVLVNPSSTSARAILSRIKDASAGFLRK